MSNTGGVALCQSLTFGSTSPHQNMPGWQQLLESKSGQRPANLCHRTRRDQASPNACENNRAALSTALSTPRTSAAATPATMLTRSHVPSAAAGQQKLRSAARISTVSKPSANSSRSIARVAAPSRETSVDVDNAERARLESSDAFAELVAINEKKQSVNRPQKVSLVGGPDSVSLICGRVSRSSCPQPASAIHTCIRVSVVKSCVQPWR